MPIYIRQTNIQTTKSANFPAWAIVKSNNSWPLGIRTTEDWILFITITHLEMVLFMGVAYRQRLNNDPQQNIRLQAQMINCLGRLSMPVKSCALIALYSQHPYTWRMHSHKEVLEIERKVRLHISDE